MPPGPVPQDPGRDEDPRPVPAWPEWMDDPAYLTLRAADEGPGDPDLDEDSEDAPPPEVDEQELAAEADRITADLAREAALLASLGASGGPRRRDGSTSPNRPGTRSSVVAGQVMVHCPRFARLYERRARG